jgi:hypothetical protein
MVRESEWTKALRALRALGLAAQIDLEERAAIMEFDGGLSREDAEREAVRLVAQRWNGGAEMLTNSGRDRGKA